MSAHQFSELATRVVENIAENVTASPARLSDWWRSVNPLEIISFLVSAGLLTLVFLIALVYKASALLNASGAPATTQVAQTAASPSPYTQPAPASNTYAAPPSKTEATMQNANAAIISNSNATPFNDNRGDINGRYNANYYGNYNSGSVTSNVAGNRVSAPARECRIFNNAGSGSVWMREGCDYKSCDTDPSTQSMQLGNGLTVWLVSNSQPITSANGFSWVKIKINLGDEGYVASNKIRCDY